MCTYGYSLAFVPWEYWVKHIDWMAMNGAPQLAESLPPGCCVPILWQKKRCLFPNPQSLRPGINVPLAFVGQEWVWSQVFKGYGLSLEDQYDFYSGPAFLPWFRMGNMKGFGGPLTEDWMEKRKALNIKMLSRMRE